ncbi:MAG: hypothetical protein CMF59_16745 [Leptospiraceae bacterium]|nr:hypothetical protein [Leptospiraceae bacterium]
MKNECYSSPAENYQSKIQPRSIEIDESLRGTIFRMHKKGGWLTKTIADYLSGQVESVVYPSEARDYLIKAHGSREKYERTERANIAAQRLEYETDMPGSEKVRLPGDRI